MPGGVRRWLVAGTVAAAVAAGVWFALGRGERPALPDAAGGSADQRAPGAGSIAGDAVASRPGRRPAAPPPAADADPPADLAGDLVPEPDADTLAAAWASVDLDEVRAAMPDNLYWLLGMPTQDEQVQEARAAERARWNVEYGKILSGTASDEEIRAYYDHRARLSGDYVEFTSYLLDHYGEQLPERDVGLLGLARRLNLARLEEIPRKVEEAMERKRQQDEARAKWLADEAEFRAGQARPEVE